MAAQNDLELTFSANTENLKKGLVEAQSSVSTVAANLKRSLAQVGDGATGSAGGTASLEGRLKSLKTEMVQGDRTINFFANTLTGSLVPATSTAGEALRLFADGVVGGLGIGLAIQAVGFGLKAWKDHIEEANNKAKEFTEKGLKDAEETANRIAGILGNVWGGGNSANAARGGLRELDRQIEEAKRRVEDMKSRQGVFTGPSKKDIEKEEQDLKNLEAKRTELRLALPGKEHLEQQKLDKERHDKNLALDREIVSARALGTSDEQKIRLEGQAKLLDIDKKWEGTDKQKRLELQRAYRLETEFKIKELHDKLWAEDLKNAIQPNSAPMDLGDMRNTVGSLGIDPRTARNINGVTVTDKEAGYMPKSVGGPGGIDGALDTAHKNIGKSLAKEIDQESEAAKKLQQNFEAVASTAQRMGEAIGAALMSSMSPMQKVLSITKQVLGALLQMAMKQITANAFVTGSEFAKDSAMTGPWGMFAAPAAMAGGIALVMGLLGSLPSAAGGMKVPDDTLAFIHKDEHVIPARIARQYEKGAAGVGVTLNVTMQSSMVDTRGMERALTRYDGGLQRGMRKLQRQRRGA